MGSKSAQKCKKSHLLLGLSSTPSGFVCNQSGKGLPAGLQPYMLKRWWAIWMTGQHLQTICHPVLCSTIHLSRHETYLAHSKPGKLGQCSRSISLAVPPRLLMPFNHYFVYVFACCVKHLKSINGAAGGVFGREQGHCHNNFCSPVCLSDTPLFVRNTFSWDSAHYMQVLKYSCVTGEGKRVIMLTASISRWNKVGTSREACRMWARWH